MEAEKSKTTDDLSVFHMIIIIILFTMLILSALMLITSFISSIISIFQELKEII